MDSAGTSGLRRKSSYRSDGGPRPRYVRDRQLPRGRSGCQVGPGALHRRLLEARRRFVEARDTLRGRGRRIVGQQAAAHEKVRKALLSRGLANPEPGVRISPFRAEGERRSTVAFGAALQKQLSFHWIAEYSC